MFYIVKIYVLLLLLFFINLKASAEEFWRLRYFLPSSSESEITRDEKKYTAKANPSGHSVNLILNNGIGLGYNTSRKSVSIENVHYKFKNHFLDISYTIGHTFSFTIGAGRLIYGKSELSFSGKNFVTESSKGESVFFDCGIPFIVGEFIFRYRLNYIEYDNLQTQIDDESLVLQNSVKISSSQFNVGIGILF